jgi:hypothetical protein
VPKRSEKENTAVPLPIRALVGKKPNTWFWILQTPYNQKAVKTRFEFLLLFL